MALGVGEKPLHPTYPIYKNRSACPTVLMRWDFIFNFQGRVGRESSRPRLMQSLTSQTSPENRSPPVPSYKLGINQLVPTSRCRTQNPILHGGLVLAETETSPSRNGQLILAHGNVRSNKTSEPMAYNMAKGFTGEPAPPTIRSGLIDKKKRYFLMSEQYSAKSSSHNISAKVIPIRVIRAGCNGCTVPV